jgi:hypothetical protein
MTFDEWVEPYHFNTCEFAAAEMAWTFLLQQVRDTLRAASPTERTAAGLRIMMETELEAME